jgi:excisionase family DNA binding protein
MELIEVREAAEILGVSYAKMLKIVKTDDFPAAVKLGLRPAREHYRINKTKLIQWIDGGGLTG